MISDFRCLSGSCTLITEIKHIRWKCFEYLYRAKDTQDLLKSILYLLNNANKRWFALKKGIKVNYSKEKFTTKVPLKSDHRCPQHALSLPHFWPHFSLLSQILLFLQWCINHSSFHLIRKKKCAKSQFILITFHYFVVVKRSRLLSSLSKNSITIYQHFQILITTKKTNKNFHKSRKPTKLHSDKGPTDYLLY